LWPKGNDTLVALMPFMKPYTISGIAVRQQQGCFANLAELLRSAELVLRGTDRIKGIVVALSGTPIKNTMFELHSQFDFA